MQLERVDGSRRGSLARALSDGSARRAPQSAVGRHARIRYQMNASNRKQSRISTSLVALKTPNCGAESTREKQTRPILNHASDTSPARTCFLTLGGVSGHFAQAL